MILYDPRMVKVIKVSKDAIQAIKITPVLHPGRLKGSHAPPAHLHWASYVGTQQSDALAWAP